MEMNHKDTSSRSPEEFARPTKLNMPIRNNMTSKSITRPISSKSTKPNKTTMNDAKAIILVAKLNNMGKRLLEYL